MAATSKYYTGNSENKLLPDVVSVGSICLVNLLANPTDYVTIQKLTTLTNKAQVIRNFC